MKTRQEMVYDFMLAMAPNWSEIESNLLMDEEEVSNSDIATNITGCAMALADAYLETLS
jgi:hypothetical protein